jgi:putative ABC transport system permease protein
MTVPDLSAWDLALAASLLLINAAMSILLRLRLERMLVVAFLRMIVQLLLVGLILRWLFTQGGTVAMLLAAVVMLVAATVEASRRPTQRFQGWWMAGLSGVTLTVIATLATALALVAIANAGSSEQTWTPRVVLPVLGMILGNSLTGVSLALSTLLDLAVRERASIEARLAQGATRRDAFGGILTQTLKTAMLPVINGMSVAGLVTLPGMMTGQILAGADPLEAAKYQILILCAISGASALGALMAVFGGLSLLTDARHRLRLDRLVAASAPPSEAD